jgi:purine-nucleoside phosphorylase
MSHRIHAAVDTLRNHLASRPRLGIVLGSGLGSLADELENPVRIRFDSIPGFPVSTVSGHRGEAIGGRLCRIDLLALSGRVHYYEGYPIGQVVMPIHVLAGLGIRAVIITNAAGAINTSFNIGDLIAVKDHIDLMGVSPACGHLPTPDPARMHSRRLRALARTAAGELGITLGSGVYVGCSGPSYETPAEIRSFRARGGDLVGMSAVPEIIAAHSLGMEVLVLSLVTNMAAGVDDTRLSHESVIERSAAALPQFKALVKKIIKKTADKVSAVP